MKKLILFVTAIVFAFANTIPAHAQISVDAASAVLMNCDTGKVLYAKNPNDKRAIASLTKIMTALIAIEDGNLDDEVTITKEAANQPPSKLHLHPGDKLSLRDLLYGLLLKSGNDAAYQIAQYIGGNVDSFVKLMNQKAKALGLSKTIFYNPSGLPKPSNNYSTAEELAKLMCYAMKNPTFRKIDGTKVYNATSMMGIPYTFIHHDKLVRFVPYVIAGKTGFTSEAGRTLISVAKKDGIELVAVTLNDPSDWNDQLKMFKYGFEQYGIKVPTPEIRSDDTDEHEQNEHEHNQ